MGWGAARKLRRAIDGLERVLAIEVMTAARGIELRDEAPGPRTGAAIEAMRETVQGIGPDRILADDIERTRALVDTGALLGAAGIHHGGNA
jgi:histidine ammonia-lyase